MYPEMRWSQGLRDPGVGWKVVCVEECYRWHRGENKKVKQSLWKEKRKTTEKAEGA